MDGLCRCMAVVELAKGRGLVLKGHREMVRFFIGSYRSTAPV